MRSKEKFVMFLLFLMFLFTAGMFYYQNVYLKDVEQSNKQYVAIAIKDIAKGATFKEGENYGVVEMKPNSIFKDYLKYGTDDFKGLEGSKANSAILKNEVLTKGRIADKEVSENTFRLFIKPDSKVDVEKGDRVNVYTQIKYKDKEKDNLYHYKTYRIMEDVIVQNVVNKKNSNGADLGVMEYMEIHVTEEDSLNYYLSEYLTEQKSQILVLEYKDIVGEFESNVTPIEDMEGYQKGKQEFIKNEGDLQINTESEEQTNGQ